MTATFTFTSPTGSTQTVTATGVADPGAIGDPGADYTLSWLPTTVLFGSGGSFSISMNQLTFTDQSSLTQTATITLLSPGVAVPEPATLALLGLGLLGFVALRRKSARNDTV